MKIDVTHATKYLNSSTKPIINNFINRIDGHISGYVNLTQKLYDNLYIYTESKINNHNSIAILFEEYEKEFHSNIKYNSNFGLLEKLYKTINNEKEYYINFIQSNVISLTNDYFNNCYLKSNDQFLEYPEEILYKVKQYQNELNNSLDNLINKINIIYRKRIINIIASTNIFIRDLINNDNKFILVNIENKNIINEFIIPKKVFILKKFENYSNYLNEISNKISDIEEQNSFLKINNEKNFVFTESNFYSPSSSIFQNLDSFISDLEDLINQTFIHEICECTEQENLTNSTIDIDLINSDLYTNSSDIINNTNFTNCSDCYTVKHKSSLPNYSYNFNVMKIRTGLFYTKASLENIMNIYDDINYDELFNIEIYNNNENLLNDKNIFNVYNSTLSFLKENNEESNILLEEQHQFLHDYIMDFYYYLDDDYYPYLKKYEKVLNLEDAKFKDYYKNYIQSRFNQINDIISQFNETLYRQIYSYNIYNIDKNNLFSKNYEDYFYTIKNSFQIFKSNIKALNKNYIFLNSFRNHMLNLQKKKRNFYKSIIDEMSREHDFHLLNMTLEIGDVISNLLQNDYNEDEFSYLFEYINITDININPFLNYLNACIYDFENNILQQFSNIYKEFLENFNENISNFVDQNYISELKENYTNCLNYSIDQLEQTLKEDAINYQKYLNYLEYISNNSTDNTSDNISEVSEAEAIEEFIFVNKTEILLNCDINNYYNYSVKYYNDFEEKYKNILNELINEIITINSNDSIIIYYMTILQIMMILN